LLQKQHQKQAPQTAPFLQSSGAGELEKTAVDARFQTAGEMIKALEGAGLSALQTRERFGAFLEANSGSVGLPIRESNHLKRSQFLGNFHSNPSSLVFGALRSGSIVKPHSPTAQR
jgi:hypothetical protein